MRIDWMTKGEINEAIPPAYTEYTGRAILTHLAVENTGSAVAGD